MSYIALVDCNNFFVSCERVFNPKLINAPVVVLSCNDGCIIARSQEIKAMGVPMGAPYFQWAEFLKKRHAVVCSSNFSLYADLSHRVMQTLSYFNPEMEIYSIDEAFLRLEGIEEPLKACCRIRQKVLQWTGIPVSIGIATTKTLAKVANFIVKKKPDLGGVYLPSSDEVDKILETLEIGHVWGIGRRLNTFLAKKEIFTADQFRKLPDLWIQKNLSVTGLRTAWELRGISCSDIDETSSYKQSIMTSRSFGHPIFAQEELRQAVCHYTARGCEKLREENSLATWLQVFIMTGLHQKENNIYGNQAYLTLPQPSAYTPLLLDYATQGLKAIFRAGFAYKKVGVLLGGLVRPHNFQQDLFIPQNPQEEAKKNAALHLLSQANEQFGYKILQFASEGIDRPWKMKQDRCSPCATTRWSELLTIYI